MNRYFKPTDDLTSTQEMMLGVICLEKHYSKIVECQRKWYMPLPLAIETVYRDYVETKQERKAS